ncbi:MAG TPA: type II toxin-antitoxin system VapC family toxin [Solirubrobacterales bacterium]|jgi:predicted nucleic acid-binding protein|nr:type II toxin-antitoxin system VapC family toxin [Solirubrobacterales bacterium]
MPDEARRIYWDSCVPLSYLNDDPERVPTIEELFKQARAEEIELLTSSVSRVEVAFVQSEKASGVLDAEAEKAIEAFWSPGSPIKTVEFYDLIGDSAKALIRKGIEQGWGNLKPMDAIHLATAQRLAVSEMHSYDERIKKWSGHLGFPITDAGTAQGILAPETSSEGSASG